MIKSRTAALAAIAGCCALGAASTAARAQGINVDPNDPRQTACRGSALRVSVAGLPVLEPVVAHPGASCGNDDQSPAQPIAQATPLLNLGLSGLRAKTVAPTCEGYGCSPASGSHTTAAVSSLSITSGALSPVWFSITADDLTASANASFPTTSGTSTVHDLKLCTGAPLTPTCTPLSYGADGAPTDTTIAPGIVLHTNWSQDSFTIDPYVGVTKGITRRALWLQTPLGDVVAAEAFAQTTYLYHD